VKKVLLVEVSIAVDTLGLKKLWVDVPSWECRVLALKSSSMASALDIYVFGWDGTQLKAKTIQLNTAAFSILKTHLIDSVLDTLAAQDPRYKIDHLNKRIRIWHPYFRTAQDDPSIVFSNPRNT